MLIPRFAIASVALYSVPGLSGSTTERSFVVFRMFSNPLSCSSDDSPRRGPLLPLDHAPSGLPCKAQAETSADVPHTARTLGARVAIDEGERHGGHAAEVRVVGLGRPPCEQQCGED